VKDGSSSLASKTQANPAEGAVDGWGAEGMGATGAYTGMDGSPEGTESKVEVKPTTEVTATEDLSGGAAGKQGGEGKKALGGQDAKETGKGDGWGAESAAATGAAKK
jgi:hypothetical protein